MKTTRTLLLASAAVVAMGLGISSKAQAFDEVNWTWNKTVDEIVIKDIFVNVEVSPTGMTEIEKIQMNIGDVTATSVVSGIDNNTPGIGEGGTVLIDESFVFQTEYDDDLDPDGIAPVAGTGGDLLDAQLTGGEVDEGGDLITVNVDITGEVDIEALEGINEAVDLPKVESIATAVGNNQSIESSVSVQLHDAQYNWGGFSEPGSTQFDPFISGEAFDATGNTHTNLLLSAGLAAALGVITPGQVTATSTVTDISNASVDSDATAVGNNLSVDLAAVTPDDALLIADLTQFNYADVTATSLVTGVSVDNYVGFGEAGLGPCGGCLEGAVQTPLVSSVATAVGNNVSISVSSPGIID